MAKTKKTVNSTWKSIEQPKLKRGATTQSRIRRLKWVLRGFLGSLAIVLLALLTWGVFLGFQRLTRWVEAVGPSQCLRGLVFETDGVLTRDWIEAKASLPWGTMLLDVDIIKIRDGLSQDGQIENVIVERKFPDTLKIKIQEAQPLMRIAVQEYRNRSVVYLVSRTGCVYSGKNYPSATLSAMPYLEGIRLQAKRQGGYFSIVGVPVLAEFFDVIQQQHPELFAQIKSISGARFQGNSQAIGSTIEVKMQSGGVVCFAPHSFKDQLDRLAYILHYLKENAILSFKKIDLTLEDQAAVELDRGRLDMGRRLPKRL